MRLSLVCFVVAVSAAVPVQAASAPWLFVPVSASAPEAAMERGLRALEQAAGEGAIRNVAAAQQFERLRSREPLEMTEEEIARINTLAEAAVKMLGSNRLAKGQLTLEQAEGPLAGAHGDAYRRSRERVQTLFDACLFSAMLRARAQHAAEAAEQMAHCLRAYPSFAPEGEPEIQPLFDAASSEVPHGILNVDGDASCLVRANGIELGRAPLKTVLPVGEYRVQLECTPAAPGRVHLVRVGEGATRVAADPLDVTVRTRRGLWLQRSESADEDAQSLGRLLGAQVVLLRAEGGGVRVRVQGRDIAVLAPDTDARPILPLLETPAAADSPASSAAPQAPALVLEPPPAQPATTFTEVPSRTPLEYVAGISLAVVGAGALTVGWVLYAQRYSLRHALYNPNVPFDKRSEFDHLGGAVLGVSAFGALALTAAEPFLVADDGVPTAAWVISIGGLGLAVAGLGFGLAADHCEPQVASRRPSGLSCGFVDDATFGPQLVFHALPLLALPAMYGLRRLLGGGSTVVLGFEGRTGQVAGHVSMGGTF